MLIFLFRRFQKLKEKFIPLIRLQFFDDRIQEIQRDIAKCPTEIENLERELKGKEEAFREDIKKLEELKKKRREIEREIQDLEEKIRKSNDKLSNVKTNKEYRAALLEIEELKKLKFDTEDNVLQIMEEIESLEKICDQNKRRFEKFKKEYELKKKAITARMKALDDDLNKTIKKRDECTLEVDPELLKKYNFLKDRKGGKAISAVIKGVCQSCNMGIPPQRFNELIKGEKVLTCPNCDRLIYWGDDEALNDIKQEHVC
ncbi:MAG TPA: hypothetical protein ENF54_01875 [Desulfobacteraceae bacterium]|nr:hypothetical protein [Desulfobacteraceae bacterium]